MRGEGSAGLKRRSLPAAITAASLSLGTVAPLALRACGQRLAERGSQLGRVWEQARVFRRREMDTPSPPEREHVPEGAGASEGLSKQPLSGEDSTQTCCEVMR